MAWPLPTEYGISTPYGIRGKMWSCNRNIFKRGVHTGIDFAAPLGTPLYAAVAGQIRHRNYGAAFGKYQFAISPDRDQPYGSGEVFYAHCSARLPEGTRVEVGEYVGRVGKEGNVDGPHLHFEFHPSTKGVWGCNVHADPAPTLKHGSWAFPANHRVYQKYLKFDGHEQNPDRVSDSIKALQEVLIRHGYENLLITGKYWTQTDAAVRADQAKHVPPADPDGQSFVGPAQWKHLKEATRSPYIFVPEVVTEAPTQPIAPVAAKPFLVPSLAALRDEVDARWPDRDRSSDGWVGDAAHQASKSEHNPVGHPNGPEFGTPGAVHALDITTKDIDANRVLDTLIGDQRLWYVIHNGRIWSKTYGWTGRSYGGTDPHTKHIHVSLAADDQASAVRNENDAATWLRDEESPVTVPPGKEGTGNTVPPGKGGEGPAVGLPLPDGGHTTRYMTLEQFTGWLEQARDRGYDLPSYEQEE